MDVSYHSWAKVPIQCSYLSVCRDIYKKRNVKFYYYDLFAGDGICECVLPTGDKETWNGSAKSALYYCNQMGDSFGGAVFNEPKNLKRLKENISDLIEHPELIQFYQEDANIVIDKILPSVPTTKQTFFFLDPCGHSDLHWATIEKIGNHSDTGWYKNKTFTRRPEIMVNLMTYGLSMNYKIESAKDSITRALGTDEWVDEVKKYEKENKTYIAFRNIFEKQLRKLFYDPLIEDDVQPKPYYFEVREPKRNCHLYYMFFISSHPLANEIFGKLQPFIEKYKNEKMAEWVCWVARAGGNALLTDFI